MVNLKVVPLAGRLSASIRPPWASTRFFAMASPRPAPPVARVREGSERRKLIENCFDYVIRDPVSSVLDGNEDFVRREYPRSNRDLAAVGSVPYCVF